MEEEERGSKEIRRQWEEAPYQYLDKYGPWKGPGGQVTPLMTRPPLGIIIAGHHSGATGLLGSSLANKLLD